MFVEISRYLVKGRFHQLWVEPEYHFKYYGFEWIQPLPAVGMYALASVILVAAAFFTVGFLYRLSAITFAIGFTYLFLLDQAKFMNHFYLICLLAWISIFLPADQLLALNRKKRSHTAPAWTLYLLRFQVGIVYFFGGIAKLNHDWLRGDPMRSWLINRADWPVFGEFFQTPFAPYFFSYGGLIFDLLVVPALLWKRTRVPAFFVAVLFHVMNSHLFSIGIFPWMAIALTALFFTPSWPRKVLRKPTPHLVVYEPKTHRKYLLPLLVAYAMFQVLIPLRHLLYPGNVSWTEEGHRFSWHMMLRSKTVVANSFVVIHPESGSIWKLDPSEYLSRRQHRKMLTRPDMIQQFCAHIAELMESKGFRNCSVRAVVYCSLNNHEPALLVDPEANLASVPRNLSHASWILPQKQIHKNQPKT